MMQGRSRQKDDADDNDDDKEVEYEDEAPHYSHHHHHHHHHDDDNKDDSDNELQEPDNKQHSVQRNNNNNKHRSNKHDKHNDDDDALFLETCQDASAAAAATAAGAAVTELHRSNVLRLLAEQTHQECHVELNVQEPQHVSWAGAAHAYLQTISQLIMKATKTTTTTTAKPVDHHRPLTTTMTKDYPFAWFSDRAAGTATSPQGSSLLGAANGLLDSNFLKTHIPAYQPGAISTATGNAHVLPTLDLWVLIDKSSNTSNNNSSNNNSSNNSSNNNESMLWLDAKDYLRYRYIDKRNLVVWYLAKLLLQEDIGHVYWEYQHADCRKPVLMVVPPTTTAATTSGQQQETVTNNNNKKSKKHQKKSKTQQSQVPMTKKLRYRVRILVGMENTDWMASPLRLLPNRCNLASTTTATTTSTTTTNIAATTACGAAANNNNTITWTSTTGSSQYYNQILLEDVFSIQQESANLVLQYCHHHQQTNKQHLQQVVLLTQIWALQRGLLRNHDGWTTHDIYLLMVYLFRSKQANPRMAAPQLLAALFQLLQSEWLNVDENDETTTTTSSTAAATAKRQNDHLLRKAPSEGYDSSRLYQQQSTTRKRRTVLVMPRQEGYTTHQTAAQSEMANLYAEHTRTSPVTDHDPPTLLELYETLAAENNTVVFLDSSMTFNYTGRWSPSFVRVLRREAHASLRLLHASAAIHAAKSFDALFRVAARFWQRHDAYMHIPIAAFQNVHKLCRRKQGLLSEWKCGDPNDLGVYEYLARAVVHVLTMALGDRVTAIRLLSTGNGNVEAMKQQQKQHQQLIGSMDSDEIPRHGIKSNDQQQMNGEMQSPTGLDTIVIGISINPDTCHRFIDRGPPADDAEATKSFLSLWGKDKAELRRFKDGAIVYAVVWGTTGDNEDVKNDKNYVQFENDGTVQGAIVERIVRHVLKLHFLRKKTSTAMSPQFSLRNMVSIVDGVTQLKSQEDTVLLNPTAAHRMAMKAFDAFSDFLRKYSIPTVPVPGTTDMKSRLEIPLTIDAVEPLGPALRYAALHPPLPHPLLGGKATTGVKRASGAVQYEPIKIQIRFGSSSKWPGDLRAIGAAKTAMLIQLTKGIEAMKESGLYRDEFDGPMVVTPAYADIGFMGYVFRVMVRADPEIKLLESLVKPSREAMSHLRLLTHHHVVAATHHSVVHAVYTNHSSSSTVVRMAKKWASSHLLSDLVPFEALELVVCHAYTELSSPFDAPGTAVAGFLRFLSVMAKFDWEREPMIVDPQRQFSEDDISFILKAFERARGSDSSSGPAMYIVSPTSRSNDEGHIWSFTPSFTEVHPERVILKRVSALAGRTYAFLQKQLQLGDVNDGTAADASSSWTAAFQETPTSFRSYSALFRTNPDLLVDVESSSTGSSLEVQWSKERQLFESSYMRSMRLLMDGPKELRIRLYRNLAQDQPKNPLLLEWRPVYELVQTLRQKLGHLALFFYNDLCPDVIAVLWRPTLIVTPHSFSAMQSEYMRPVLPLGWKPDTLVQRNVTDMLREAAQFTTGVIVDTKVFDWGPSSQPAASSLSASKSFALKKRKAGDLEEDGDSSSNSSGSSSNEE